MSLTAGTRLGPYEIQAAIGAGGMGEVYKARDTRLDRTVAIKVLPPAFASDPSRRARFELEAKTVAGLSHPHICSLYDVGDHEGATFLVMEHLGGETLAARLQKGPLPLDRALTIAIDIADALAAAHLQGVIHRDLKPGNVMLTSAGAKILDFGLAKVRAEPLDPTATTESLTVVTAPGVALGTVGYMSPEQILGLPVTERSDLFSFGVVLHEMLAGARPFTGNSAMAVCDAILHAQPRDFGDHRVPGKLKAIVRRLLEKDAPNRYAGADEVCKELRSLQAWLAPARLPRTVRIVIGAALILAILVAAWFWRDWSRQRWALTIAVPEIQRLIDEGQYAKAAALTREARAVRRNDPSLEGLWTRVTGVVSLATTPSGADVAIRPYRADPNAWQSLGTTPLKKVRVPRDVYVWRVAKPGFAPVFYIGEPPGEMLAPGFGRPVFDETWRLRPEGTVPPEMVVVTNGSGRLGYPLAGTPSVKVADFLIDRHEVTNEEYKKFVDAGGYERREFWKQPFTRDGRTVTWEDAVALFHDVTGRPGPATWEVGDYRKGQAKYPVAGVSWYEAAAYAAFVGKSLPTAYHWARAAQNSGPGLSAGFAHVITPGSNFRFEGTQAVGSETALSGFGTTDMAGNVKEWCLNEARNGKRLILGGGFGEPSYMFNHADEQSPWDRLANFGFRCVKLDAPPPAAAAARLEVSVHDYWKEKPVPDDVFRAYTELFAYDKGELNAEVEETATAEAWPRVKVSFDAAYGHERVRAHLLLPRNASPPFQAIVIFPGVGAFLDDKLDLADVEDARGFLVKSGRALIFPICKGMYERHDGFVPGRGSPAANSEHAIAWVKDVARTLDYLETRKDIDATKVAYFGDSLGGLEAPIQLAIEKRFKTAILSSGGLSLPINFLAQADPFNYAPHVTVPVLMLNGRYDATFPLESSQLPLFQFLGSSVKRRVPYEGGHGAFPRPQALNDCLNWLDKYLGPVRR